MCFGTFDVLHRGHEHYLREARKLGDFLVVVVALDGTVAAVKGRAPARSEGERLRRVERLGIADRVVLGRSGDKLAVIEDEKPDVLAFGYDQKAFTGSAAGELRKRGLKVEVVRIGAFRPERFKSSLLRGK